MREADAFGVPLDAFGRGMPPEFFELLGRMLAVNGKIEYLKARLDHLPSPDRNGVRKVEQFFKRYDLGRLERNAIVHSYWVWGAHTRDREVVLGVRYKVRKKASGEIATVSIRDVPEAGKEQVVVQYNLDKLRKLLKRDIATMLIGEHAHTEVGLKWAFRQSATPPESSSP